MFIINPTQNREMKITLRAIKQKMGKVPPHWELYAGINPTRFKMFLEEINYLTTHSNINQDFFTMLRYCVAIDNSFEYCVKFNSEYLLAKGYTQEQLKAITVEKTLPLNRAHQALFDATLKAIYIPEEFTADVIDELKSLNWSDGDIIDAVDHGAFLFKFHRVLKAYLK